MKNLTKILFTLFFVAMTAFSSVTLAEKAKYPPAEVIASINTKISEASALIAAGGAKNEEVAALLKQAKDISKEVSANDKVDRERQKMVGDLKTGIAAAKEGKMDVVTESIKSAVARLETMKTLIN